MGKPRIAGISAVLAFALFLAGCGNGEAPAGRWEGFSESAQWLIAVRLQVDPPLAAVVAAICFVAKIEHWGNWVLRVSEEIDWLRRRP